MCHSYQNVLQLEKYATARKINTVIKICPNQKNGTQLEKRETVRKIVTVRKNVSDLEK